MSFQEKQLAPPKRVCVKLREIRESKHLSLVQLSEKTKISRRYLESIEDCKFEDIPFAEIYKKNFIKCYAEALGVNPDEFLEQFVQEEIKPNEKIVTYQSVVNPTRLLNFPAIIRYLLLGGAAAIVVFYLGMQIKKIIEPPSLTVFSPKDGYVANDQALTVQGQTEKETRVSINGQDIKNNEAGQFNEVVNLSPGMNTIVISAKKKYGKITSQTKYVILKERSAFSLK